MNSAKGKEKILPGISVGDFAPVSKATGEEKAGLGEVGQPSHVRHTDVPSPAAAAVTHRSAVSPSEKLLQKRCTKCLPPRELLLAVLLWSGAVR